VALLKLNAVVARQGDGAGGERQGHPHPRGRDLRALPLHGGTTPLVKALASDSMDGEHPTSTRAPSSRFRRRYPPTRRPCTTRGVPANTIRATTRTASTARR
jgi:hypothetical protein